MVESIEDIGNYTVASYFLKKVVDGFNWQMSLLVWAVGGTYCGILAVILKSLGLLVKDQD